MFLLWGYVFPVTLFPLGRNHCAQPTLKGARFLGRLAGSVWSSAS